ncbi:MAG: copper homeostasis protein [Bacteroidaceae bacterium]|nr:copper homeostasis protein [Bacteroidaceae bacterium]
MKKMLTMTAVACLAACAISCGNKKEKNAPIGYESYTDSIYMVNDTTLGELQTYTYEGVLPTDAGIPANYMLTIYSYDLNNDGSYSLIESYTEANGAARTQYDEGEVLVMVGIPNDSTAIVYELISYSNRPRLRLAAEGDSALHKLDKDFRRASHDARHKLHRR